MDDDWVIEDDYHLITESSHYAHIKDRRNRVKLPHCSDEPTDQIFRDYQLLLDSAYGYKKDGRLDIAFALLDQQENQRFPASYYQVVRSEYLKALYFAQRDELVRAADYYRRAAIAAKRIPDWALVAELKYMESGACMGADPKQLYRSFESARDALEAWRCLPNRGRAGHDHFEFKLADAAGVRAQNVGDNTSARIALLRARYIMRTLRERSGVPAGFFVNDEIYLEWDWAGLYLSEGDPKRAFQHILRTRRKANDLLNPTNTVRLLRLIAYIALVCVEEGGVTNYSRIRLLSVAEKELDNALEVSHALINQPSQDASQVHNNQQAYALVLLTRAKWMGLIRPRAPQADRVAAIQEAEGIAHANNDAALLGHVDIAWGDEFVVQGKVEQARARYEKALADMTRIDLIELVRKAQLRLKRLPPPPPAQP